MSNAIKIVIWNANGLSQHQQEIQYFLENNNIDIMLVSETHFTNKSFIKIPNYSIYHTQHPGGTARGGTAVIIKNKIKHHLTDHYQQHHIQATNVVVEDNFGSFTVSAIYCPPRYNINKQEFCHFFSTLGTRYIAGGDYNAKNATQYHQRKRAVQSYNIIKS